jgi:hypothetical protein
MKRRENLQEQQRGENAILLLVFLLVSQSRSLHIYILHRYFGVQNILLACGHVSSITLVTDSPVYTVLSGVHLAVVVVRGDINARSRRNEIRRAPGIPAKIPIDIDSIA